jgi:hypothetical protein
MFQIQDCGKLGAMLVTLSSESMGRKWVLLLPKEPGEMRIVLRFQDSGGIRAIVNGTEYIGAESRPDLVPEAIELVYEDEHGNPINALTGEPVPLKPKRIK